MSNPIDFYYWPTPNGWKISIAFEEMGLAHNVMPVDIDNGEQHSAAFRAISPGGKMPAIVDPDGPNGQPISVFESGVILQYLARKSGKFYPNDERARLLVDQWLMWQMSALGPNAGQAHQFLKYAPNYNPPVVIPYAQDRFRDEVKRLYKVLDERLAAQEFVAGDYSIADMAIWPWISRYRRQQQNLDDTPHLKRWFLALWARPAVQAGRNLMVKDSLKFTPANRPELGI